jgi:hypothetical protein
MTYIFKPGDRVRLTVEGKTLKKGACGSVVPSRGLGGFVDVRWDDGQLRAMGPMLLAHVPTSSSE